MRSATPSLHAPARRNEAYFTGKVITTETGTVEITPVMAKQIYKYLLKNDYTDDTDQVAETYHEAKANRAWRPIRKISRAALGETISDLLRPSGDEFSKGEEVRQQALDDPEHFWVCEEDGRVVGFITFALDEKRLGGEILNNAADPDCGIKGIGQQMYKAVLDYFRRRGMRFAKVTTGLDEGHAPARRAYERAGFDRSSQYLTYYREL